LELKIYSHADLDRGIMRYLLITLILFGCLYAVEKSQLARLHYDGGGDWYNDSDIIPNIVEHLNESLKTDFAIEQAVVKPGDNELFEYPFVFMTGHGNITFSAKEAANLREYLLRGGFLYADDDYGMDEAFRREINKVFPEKDLIEIPAEHELFYSYFNLSSGLPKTHKHDDKRPQAYAIFDEDGRIMVLYTYESNISDGWSNKHDDPEEIRTDAFEMGVNIFYYLMAGS
jgi:uncharacterized protein DUF4159